MNFILLAFALSASAFANERIRPADQLLREGYRRVPQFVNKLDGIVPEAHSLAWPVEFQDQAYTIGNSMAQFQPFDNPPYFHGGCDLRVKADAEVRSPVAGRLEAGHYSYATKADGSMEKFWMPWPQKGDPTYFEVAIVAEDGTRYEFHHVNRNNLPAEIVGLLNRGGGQVAAGALLGHAIYWPGGDYHHIHYNVVLPNLIRVNPEYVSPLIADHLPPEVKAAFAVSEDGTVTNFHGGRIATKPAAFVVALVDRQDESVYEHPVVLARLHFARGQETVWDFHRTLSMTNGRFPPIWGYFVESIRTPDGQILETEGGYGTGQSIIRLKVPAGASGAFTIELEDIAGNRTTLTGEI